VAAGSLWPCVISLLLFFLVMEHDWLSSQKGFNIDKKSQNNRESSRKTYQWETV